MFIKIPFESIIEFKTKINEITKISLEHDFNVNDGVVLGDFYVSGEYRIHAVSINKDPFNYTLPFTVDLRDDINIDTLEFNIEDFSYEVFENNKLKINIEYSLKAELKEEKEILFERVDEKELESELSFIDTFLENNNSGKENKEMGNELEDILEDLDEIKEEPKEEFEEIRKDFDIRNEELEDKNKIENPKKEINVKEKIKPVAKEIQIETKDEIEETEERISEEEEKTIMDTIKNSDDTFITYHIHIVKETETKESISSLYKVPISLISEYNNLDSITTGDKILIPQIDE